jgi:hypothetical protein
MKRHETVLHDLVLQISDLDPVCSVFAEGSVGRGEYRPDSDIDLVVVTWQFRQIRDDLEWNHDRNLFDGEQNLDVVLDTGTFQGITLDIHCRSPRNHVNLVMNGPVYRWGGTRILYDPSGIAQWGIECTKQLLADNPEYAGRLKRFHDQHQEWKQDKTTIREFETQLDFGGSVDTSTLIRDYESFANKSMDEYVSHRASHGAIRLSC